MPTPSWKFARNCGLDRSARLAPRCCGYDPTKIDGRYLGPGDDPGGSRSRTPGLAGFEASSRASAPEPDGGGPGRGNPPSASRAPTLGDADPRPIVARGWQSSYIY